MHAFSFSKLVPARSTITQVSLSLLVLLSVGCASQVDSPGSNSQPPSIELEDEGETARGISSTASLETGTVQTSDGVEIAYDVRGEGDTTLVFVHCWTCDRAYWQEQLDEFAAEYRVVSLDLAGHGLSGNNRDDWTVAGHAEDVRAVMDELEIDTAILIGHSMGGSISVVAAGEMPDRVIGVACVDTLQDADAGFDPAFAEQVATEMEADFIGVRSEMLGQMFLPDSDGDVEAWVAKRGETVYAPAAIALIRDFATFDLAAAMRATDVPIRCVNANALPPMILPTAVETNRQYADFDAEIMEGVGHFLLLEKPDEFNELLADAIADIEG